MDEDFNTPNLITYLNDLIKELNTKLRNKEDIVETFDKIQLVNNILGLKYDLPELTSDDKKLYNEWLDARSNKDFEKADTLRSQLMEKGII
jgi:cysteinyl-tRNA synthetase